MATAASANLIVELDDAVTGGSPERRVQILRQVTDLFLMPVVSTKPRPVSLMKFLFG